MHGCTLLCFAAKCTTRIHGPMPENQWLGALSRMDTHSQADPSEG